jgi:hypothetical protein
VSETELFWSTVTAKRIPTKRAAFSKKSRPPNVQAMAWTAYRAPPVSRWRRCASRAAAMVTSRGRNCMAYAHHRVG